ncbi:hypothetical protein, partial [Thalassoglobus sp.]|uniref:hypothetical protein n=1 Tax=Thalassoglobus sp. TaxID=2795869 RepID=UPI003AA8FAA4
ESVVNKITYAKNDRFVYSFCEKSGLEQFALEERISLGKMLFATKQNLQTNSKDALSVVSRFLPAN